MATTTTTMVDQIIQIIEYIGQKFGIAINWSEENILPIVQTLIEKIARWCVAENVFYVSLSFIGIIVGIIIFTISVKKIPTINHNTDDFELTMYIGGMIIFGVIAIAGIIGLCVNSYYLVQSIAFPELAVIEYIQDFMNK